MKSSLKKIFAAVLAVIIAFSLITASLAAYKGDLNADGNVNSTDALIVLKHSVGTYDGELDMTVADLTGDGKINSTDALKILKISAGLEEKEEIPEEPDEPTIPTTMAEIAEAYNNAVNKVIDEKAGYKKARTATVKEMNAGALSSIEMVQDVVKEFLGEGTNEYTNKKGSAEFFSKASLAASDLTSATCALDGDNYVITLNLKNGKSTANKSKASDSSALAKSGLLTGKDADPKYDYLSSEGIYKTVSTVDKNVSVESVSATNSNVKIIAVVNAETGNMVSLSVSYDWTVSMTKIKYSLITVKSADGKAQTAVELKDFEW